MLLLILPSLAAPPATPGCEVVPPGANQYKLAAGFEVARANTLRAREEAMAAARASARAQLEKDLCGAMPDDCQKYASYITEWQMPGVYDDKTRMACATAVVELRLLQPDRQRLDAEAQVSKLGDALARQAVAAGVRAVRLTDPHRSDGCALPELEPVRMWVRSRLSAAGVASLADDAPADAPELDLNAVVSGSDVTLAGILTLSDGTELSAEPVRFFAGAYGVPATGGKCVGSERLGLDKRGQQRGEVSLDMKVPTRGGGLCVGQPVDPVVTTDRPARVHVYSVDSSGAAYHIWPIEGADRVEGSIGLGQSWAVPSPRGDDETMVAVAVPESAELGPIAGHTGFCRVPTAFGESFYPRGASVVSQTWHVINDPTECGAPHAEVPTAALLEQVLNEAPVCR